MLCIFVVVCIIITVLAVSVYANSAYASGSYVEEFEAYLNEKGLAPHYEGQDWYVYDSPCYEYYSENNDSGTPDWVLVFGAYIGLALCLAMAFLVTTTYRITITSIPTR